MWRKYFSVSACRFGEVHLGLIRTVFSKFTTDLQKWLLSYKISKRWSGSNRFLGYIEEPATVYLQRPSTYIYQCTAPRRMAEEVHRPGNQIRKINIFRHFILGEFHTSSPRNGAFFLPAGCRKGVHAERLVDDRWCPEVARWRPLSKRKQENEPFGL